MHCPVSVAQTRACASSDVDSICCEPVPGRTWTDVTVCVWRFFLDVTRVHAPESQSNTRTVQSVAPVTRSSCEKSMHDTSALLPSNELNRSPECMEWSFTCLPMPMQIFERSNLRQETAVRPPPLRSISGTRRGPKAEVEEDDDDE